MIKKYLKTIEFYIYETSNFQQPVITVEIRPNIDKVNPPDDSWADFFISVKGDTASLYRKFLIGVSFDSNKTLAEQFCEDLISKFIDVEREFSQLIHEMHVLDEYFEAQG